ncbi:NAD(P)-binding protein [Legionella cardiaca]|uniref:NAD(P)-binding protein n=1 Tax=Legionella cardiaca TaxID=1071983 RepID=A0ABY8ARN2_9GAMM|nr:NAD(P)-binding protein [Legionella cardiaca]WED43339.1 NAD(P)-binding protein [Legionella cardiaca]
MPIGKKVFSDKDIFIIIGAGPSGLFAGRALVKSGVPQKNIVFLEKNNRVGGKCYSYTDLENPSLVTEYGAALIAHNYGVVLDAIFEKKITYETVLPTDIQSMGFMQQYLQKDTIGRIKFSAAFAEELIIYEKYLLEYKHARDNNLPLPKAFELPFVEFAKQKGLTKLNDLLRPLVTGFGYGAMQVCPTFAVFEYMGHTTIPGMQLIPTLLRQGPFYAIQGGIQRLMEAIAADFEVLTEADVQSIDRSNGISVEFLHQGQKKTLKGSYLILALSPLHWPKLGLDMSATEELAVKNLTYYRYPVAICKLKGHPPVQRFFENGLQPEGFGSLALITTRDADPQPKDRLCTAYVNLPQGKNDYNLSIDSTEGQKLKSELEHVEGMEAVQLIKTHTWEDYMSMLPWETRCKLQATQFETNTGYINSCLCFEDVGCVANYGTNLIAQTFAPQPTKVYDESLVTDIGRMYRLFKAPQQAPVKITQPKSSEIKFMQNSKEKEENTGTFLHF